MGNGNYQFPTDGSLKSNAYHTKNNLLNGWKSQYTSKRSSLTATCAPQTSSLETIDRAMDIQQILFEFSQIVNSYYKFQLLIVILTAFIIIVFDCYYLLEVLNNPAQRKFKSSETKVPSRNALLILTDFRLSKMESIIYLGYQLLTNGLNVLGMVVSCSLLQNAARETAHIVHKIIVVTKDMILRERVSVSPKLRVFDEIL